jgi:hypothetical protein
MSAALNLSPKNPMMVVLLAGAAIWALSRRPAAAAAVYRPSAVGATVQQQAADAARNSQIFSAIGSFLAPVFQPSVITSAARAAVRSGDPYYGGSGEGAAIGGVIPEWIYDQVAVDAAAWNSYMGTADDATGDPYNPG